MARLAARLVEVLELCAANAVGEDPDMSHVSTDTIARLTELRLIRLHSDEERASWPVDVKTGIRWKPHNVRAHLPTDAGWEALAHAFAPREARR